MSNIVNTGWPRTLENRENGEKNSLQGKIREFEILLKIGEKSGNLNLIFVRSKCSNFIAVQMWLLVVSFCHMLKIPADLILLKGRVLMLGGVLVCCIFCFFFFSSKVDILLQT